MITASTQDCQLLIQNPQLAQVCSAYLKEFVAATFVKKDKEIEKRLKEEAVLEYFKERPFFREKFYKKALNTYRKIVQKLLELGNIMQSF